MGKKKRKGAAKVAAVLQSGSFPYHPEEEYIDKVRPDFFLNTSMAERSADLAVGRDICPRIPIQDCCSTRFGRLRSGAVRETCACRQAEIGTSNSSYGGCFIIHPLKSRLCCTLACTIMYTLPNCTWTKRHLTTYNWTALRWRWYQPPFAQTSFSSPSNSNVIHIPILLFLAISLIVHQRRTRRCWGLVWL